MKRNLGQEQFITPKKILEVMGGATGEIAAVFINYRVSVIFSISTIPIEMVSCKNFSV